MFAYQGSAITANNCSLGKESQIRVVNKVRSSNINRDKWSATMFSTPFLYLIIILNSWSRRIHRINRGLASFLDNRYLSAT